MYLDVVRLATLARRQELETSTIPKGHFQLLNTGDTHTHAHTHTHMMMCKMFINNRTS